MTTTITPALRTLALAGALAIAGFAQAQGSGKKELVQKILQSQQSEVEGVARNIVERPAAQMMQEASLVLRQMPADKRDPLARSIETEVRKYVEESYPIVRERAIKLAPSTIGATLEEKMTEDELRQLLTWLESPTNKKFQQLGPDMRNSFVQKLVADAQPAVDPKVKELDDRIRTILGVPAAPTPAASRPAGGKAAPKAPAK